MTIAGVIKNFRSNSYLFIILLIFSIALGAAAGFWFKHQIDWIKPVGDLFLNLILIIIVPMIFFSVSSAVVRIRSLKKLNKIILSMIGIFLLSGLLAAIYMLIVVILFPPAQDITLTLLNDHETAVNSTLIKTANTFTFTDFSQLLSHQHILALIIFSMLVGFAVSRTGKKAAILAIFLNAGDAVFMRIFNIILYFAPIGFFAYFAGIVADLGQDVLQHYVRIALIYYCAAIIYFVITYTLFAFVAGQLNGVKLFWKNIFLPLITAFATCSSAASIPANLLATQKMRISPEIYETMIPFGTIINKQGSVLGGVLKIVFLFGVFHLDYSSSFMLFSIIGTAMLVGTVMGAIPSGGMLGELLILNMFGFPATALISIAAISIIIDPIATMLNVTGNTANCMLVARIISGRKWFETTQNQQLNSP